MGGRPGAMTVFLSRGEVESDGTGGGQGGYRSRRRKSGWIENKMKPEANGAGQNICEGTAILEGETPGLRS